MTVRGGWEGNCKTEKYKRSKSKFKFNIVDLCNNNNYKS